MKFLSKFIHKSSLNTLCLTLQSSATFQKSVPSLLPFGDLFLSQVVHFEVWSTATSTPKLRLLRRAKCIRRPLRVVKWQRRGDATRRSAGEVKLNCFKFPPGQRQRARQVDEAICSPETSQLGVTLSFRPRPRGH